MICLGFFEDIKTLPLLWNLNSQLVGISIRPIVVVPILSFQSINILKNQQLSLREHWIIFRWYEDKNLSTVKLAQFVKTESIS